MSAVGSDGKASTILLIDYRDNGRQEGGPCHVLDWGGLAYLVSPVSSVNGVKSPVVVVISGA